MPAMYIIAIGWIFVTGLMALTQDTIFSGLITFLFAGIGPLSLLLWLLNTPQRRRRAQLADNANASESEPPHAKQ
jgi:hypothetical protein